MHTYSEPRRSGGGFLRRTESWLDRQGKGAWIAAMVVGFVLFWPVGLALLAYMIWGKKMFNRTCHTRAHHHDSSWSGTSATGNLAFDSYKTEALRRLEDEQAAFEAFLERLRSSKDKAEFDTFMDERARTSKARDAAEGDGASEDETTAKPVKDRRPGEY